MAKKQLRIGLIGYSFMGRAHSNAFHQVNHFFPSSYELVPQAVCGRDEASTAAAPNAEQIMAQLEEERVNKRARIYLRDLRRDAVIVYN